MHSFMLTRHTCFGYLFTCQSWLSQASTGEWPKETQSARICNLMCQCTQSHDFWKPLLLRDDILSCISLHCCNMSVLKQLCRPFVPDIALCAWCTRMQSGAMCAHFGCGFRFGQTTSMEKTLQKHAKTGTATQSRGRKSCRR